MSCGSEERAQKGGALGGKCPSGIGEAKKRPRKVVVLAWIVWPSKEARESGMQACMEEPVFQPGALPMPFDGKRLIFGSFEQIMKV